MLKKKRAIKKKIIQNPDVNDLTQSHLKYYEKNVKDLENPIESPDKVNELIEQTKTTSPRKKRKKWRLFRKS